MRDTTRIKNTIEATRTSVAVDNKALQVNLYLILFTSLSVLSQCLMEN